MLVLGKDHVDLGFVFLTVHHDPVLDVGERGLLNALDTLVQESTSQSGCDYDDLWDLQSPAVVINEVVH